MALSVGTAVLIAVAVIACLLAATTLVFGAFIAGMALLARPWDGNTKRDHRWVGYAPYRVFWLSTWIVRAAEYVVSLKPGTLRAGELATAFAQSQVLFALCNLGVPDLLCSGPRTAAELAAAVGPAVPVDWLDRLLATAAAYGMLKRKKVKGRTISVSAAFTQQQQQKQQQQQQQQAVACKQANLDACFMEEDDDTATVKDNLETNQKLRNNHHQQQHQEQQQQQVVPAGPPWVYSLNGVSAVLTRDSPASVVNLVKMTQDQSVAYAYLAEGIQTGKVPFELWSSGQTFWQHLDANPRQAATFDAAMHEVNQFGGSVVAGSYPWSKFDCVVDFAGGVGGFLADILRSNRKLQGVLFDQPAQIQRAETLWQTTHSSLAPRVQLVSGDMFDASSIPAPPSNSRVAYVLRYILHDWSDKDCLAILRGIRSHISAADLGRVTLLVVEITTIQEVLPGLQAYRCNTDMNMLMAYGDGKERSRDEFKALFAAAGFRLQRIRPSCGILLTVEAVPV